VPLTLGITHRLKGGPAQQTTMQRIYQRMIYRELQAAAAVPWTIAIVYKPGGALVYQT